MADPATLLMAAKAALALGSNEKTRKLIRNVLIIVLSPVAFLIAVIFGLGDAMSTHNNSMLDLCFTSDPIPYSTPAEQTAHINDMRNSFRQLDQAIAELNAQMEDGDSLDSLRLKAIFYALYFGEETPSGRAHSTYAECFVDWEERVRICEDEDGEEYEETYLVAIPLTDDIMNLPIIYGRIASAMGTAITVDDQINAVEIYFRRLYGGAVPDYGDSFGAWLGTLPVSDEPFIGADGFCSPLGESWRQLVSSPYGWRPNPTGAGKEFHTGIDLATAAGTPIRAALDGTVLYVRRSNGGYGLHLVLDHGGGFLTMYAHCSSVSVTQGSRVSAGDVIAAVGRTGRSTGNHLHFEIRNNGQTENPAAYLP